MTTHDLFFASPRILLSLAVLAGCTTTQNLGTRMDGGVDDAGGSTTEVDAGIRDGAIGNEADADRDCIDECADGESVCDGPSGYRLCGDFDADPCREWSGSTACEEGQSCNASGVCVDGPCSDQCTSGATECRGSGVTTCGDQNEDGCTEWSPSMACVTGESCQAGTCRPVESCSDECTANECVGNTFHECGQFDADPCLDRSPGLSCTPADLCLEGTCSPTMGCMSTAQMCDNPPAQTCVNANTLRVYDAVGECTAGDCNYAPRDVACPNCPSCNACAGVTCNMPPAATCASAGARRTFASSGTCEAGSCNYAPIDTACDTPPAATCANASTARTYAANGTCMAGACNYLPIDTACDTPPPDECVNDETLRVRVGRCMGGRCDFSSTDRTCSSDEICRAGQCQDRCNFGVPSMTLGSSADSVGAPAVAHHAAGNTLIVWVDFERNRVHGLLRNSSGATTDLGDLGLYASTPAASPFSRATIVADGAGFAAVWIEEHLDGGGPPRHRFRMVELADNGARTGDATITPALRIHYTDVEPRLFATPGERFLVYKGRTSDPLPQPRLVYQRLSDRSSEVVDFGEPHEVCWDGAAFAQVYATGSELFLRRMATDGTVLDSGISFSAPAGTSGTVRIAPAVDGYYLVRGYPTATAWRVRADGTRIGGTQLVERPGSITTNGTEALIVGRASTGTPTAWRLDNSVTMLGSVSLYSASTNLGLNPDGTAWTGSEWVTAFTHDAGLRDQARWMWLCI